MCPFELSAFSLADRHEPKIRKKKEKKKEKQTESDAHFSQRRTQQLADSHLSDIFKKV